MAKNYVEIAEEYAKDVISGKKTACKWEKLVAKRHLNDLKRAKKKSYPYKFDEEKAKKICIFGEMLPHTKGKWAGTLIVLEPWQIFILCCLFGWVHKDSELRRFRKALILVPRKDGKSLLAAIIGLFMLVADGEKGAEIYAGATSEKQAWEVFRPARLMALQARKFQEHYGVEVNASNINVLKTASRFRYKI